jgi:hypothetical protein
LANDSRLVSSDGGRRDNVLWPNDAKNNFILVDTQGTLNNPDYTQDWANELHPYAEGFGAIAGKFLPALRARFPGRI